MDAQRALLDALMGKDRNLAKDEFPTSTRKFSDYDVCKHHLVEFCPNTLFTNTKSDLGACNKFHDDVLKQIYQEDPNKERYGYEREFVKRLDFLVKDLDKKIEQHRERLSHQDEKPDIPLTPEVREKVDALNERILTLCNQMESLAEEGKIEESSAMAKVVEQLKEQKETLINSQVTGDARSVHQQEKRMKVCEVCGAFLVIGDTENRVRSHLEGKQHLGYLRIRHALQVYTEKLKNAPSLPEAPSVDNPAAVEQKNGDGEADRRRTDRDRSDRDRRDRPRDKDRDRDRDRERDRDRDRRRGYKRDSSDRDRYRRHSRSRSRSRSRDRRDRRDRDEKRRRY